jgi:hypothetical protein
MTAHYIVNGSANLIYKMLHFAFVDNIRALGSEGRLISEEEVGFGSEESRGQLKLLP